MKDTIEVSFTGGSDAQRICLADFIGRILTDKSFGVTLSDVVLATTLKVDDTYPEVSKLEGIGIKLKVHSCASPDVSENRYVLNSTYKEFDCRLGDHERFLLLLEHKQKTEPDQEWSRKKLLDFIESDEVLGKRTSDEHRDRAELGHEYMDRQGIPRTVKKKLALRRDWGAINQ